MKVIPYEREKSVELTFTINFSINKIFSNNNNNKLKTNIQTNKQANKSTQKKTNKQKNKNKQTNKNKRKLDSLGLVPTWPDSVGYIGCKPITDTKCQATFKIFHYCYCQMDGQTDRRMDG